MRLPAGVVAVHEAQELLAALDTNVHARHVCYERREDAVRVASATATNLSKFDLDAGSIVSNYRVVIVTTVSPFGRTPPKMDVVINDHSRDDGPWELVRRIADIAAWGRP